MVSMQTKEYIDSNVGKSQKDYIDPAAHVDFEEEWKEEICERHVYWCFYQLIFPLLVTSSSMT